MHPGTDQYRTAKGNQFAPQHLFENNFSAGILKKKQGLKPD